MTTSYRSESSRSKNLRHVSTAMLLGGFALGFSLSGCSTATRADSSAVGSGNANYPISDTGLNEQYEMQNKMVRELGL